MKVFWSVAAVTILMASSFISGSYFYQNSEGRVPASATESNAPVMQAVDLAVEKFPNGAKLNLGRFQAPHGIGYYYIGQIVDEKSGVVCYSTNKGVDCAPMKD